MWFLKCVLNLVDNSNTKVASVVHLLIIFMMLTLLYEVILRYIFNAPTVWAHELSQMFFGAYFILGGGYTLLHRSHISVDILHARLPPRKKAILDIITVPLFFLFCWALVYKGGQLAINAVISGKSSDSAWAPPLAPLMIVAVLGALLLTLQGIAKLIRDLITVAKGTEHL